MKNRRLKGLLMLGAPLTWSASFVPMVVGYVCAFLQGGADFSWRALFWIIVSLIAMASIETGKHAVNDLIDYRTGNDLAVDEQHLTPFSGGKKVLTSGILSERETTFIALGTFFAAGALGLAIVVFQAFDVLWFGIAGIVISIAYTLPPFKLCYRGLGELAVGVTYGPLILLGAYFVFADQNIILPLVMSLHMGCLIANVLLINEFPDYEADLAANKMNLLARVGKARGARWHLGFFIASYSPIVCLIAFTGNLIWLITLAMLPFMIKSYQNCKINFNDIKASLRSNVLTISLHMISGVLLMICCLGSFLL